MIIPQILKTFVRLIVILGSLSPTFCHFILQSKYNKGWKEYLSDEPTKFDRVPLTWEEDVSLPGWLMGSFIQNGPSQKQFGQEERWYSHYMDSWGKLNKITFTKAGEVLFSGRMIETRHYNRCVEAERIVPSITLAGVSPQDWTLWEKLQGITNGFDNTNVLLWRLGEEDPDNATYIATTDYPLVHMIDPESLAVTGSYHSSPLTMGSSAHWRREIGTSNSLNFHMVFNPLSFQTEFVLYRYGRTMEDRTEIGRFPIDYVSYIHMISNTPHYAVIVLYPIKMNFGKVFMGNVFDMMERIDEPTKIYLMDLEDGSVLDGFVTDDPNMVFGTHIANAWEDGGEVVFDLLTNSWDLMKEYFDLETMLNHPEDGESVIWGMKRVRLVKKTKEVIVEDWPKLSEFPRMNSLNFAIINEKYSGYKNRFIYGDVRNDYVRYTLFKRDLEDPTNYKTWFSESHYPGEMFFIPNPAGEEEDDGVLITIVFDGEREQSYVLLLDGKTFTEINRSYLPYNVRYSMHGNWFPELH